MSRVRDLIDHRDLFYVEEQQSVAEVVHRMAELHVGAILVLDGDQLRGVFSERDLMNRVVLARRDPEHTPVAEVMSRDLATVDELSSIEEAMETMRRCGCRHLPVMHGSKV